jgi:hypothetical protein
MGEILFKQEGNMGNPEALSSEHDAVDFDHGRRAPDRAGAGGLAGAPGAHFFM